MIVINPGGGEGVELGAWFPWFGFFCMSRILVLLDRGGEGCTFIVLFRKESETKRTR